MKIRKIDRPIPRVKPVQKSGDKKDVVKEKSSNGNGDRNFSKSDLDYLLRMHDKEKETNP